MCYLTGQMNVRLNRILFLSICFELKLHYCLMIRLIENPILVAESKIGTREYRCGFILNRVTDAWKGYDRWIRSSPKRMAFSWLFSALCASATSVIVLYENPFELIPFICALICIAGAAILWFRTYDSWRQYKIEKNEQDRS